MTNALCFWEYLAGVEILFLDRTKDNLEGYSYVNSNRASNTVPQEKTIADSAQDGQNVPGQNPTIPSPWPEHESLQLANRPCLDKSSQGFPLQKYYKLFYFASRILWVTFEGNVKRRAKALGLAVCSSEKGPGSRADDGEKSQMKLKGWDTGTGKVRSKSDK